MPCHPLARCSHVVSRQVYLRLKELNLSDEHGLPNANQLQIPNLREIVLGHLYPSSNQHWLYLGFAPSFCKHHRGSPVIPGGLGRYYRQLVLCNMFAELRSYIQVLASGMPMLHQPPLYYYQSSRSPLVALPPLLSHTSLVAPWNRNARCIAFAPIFLTTRRWFLTAFPQPFQNSPESSF